LAVSKKEREVNEIDFASYCSMGILAGAARRTFSRLKVAHLGKQNVCLCGITDNEENAHTRKSQS
jgi:hypothetical protein